MGLNFIDAYKNNICINCKKYGNINHVIHMFNVNPNLVLTYDTKCYNLLGGFEKITYDFCKERDLPIGVYWKTP